MAGSPRHDRAQTIGSHGPAQHPAAILHSGGAEDPVPPQDARLNPGRDKHEGFPGSTRPHRPMQRDLGEHEPRPSHRHRRSSDSTAALPGPATAGRPRPPPPQAAAATATFSSTPSLAPAPRSAGTAAHTRKTSWPAVVARTASAGPTHPC
jgi:hypothetical protein